MDYSDAVLTITGQVDGGIMGRTAIQKLIYFASQKGIVEGHFIPHYYGPYSEEVSRAIMSLLSLNFVKEALFSASDWPYNFRRYTYSLTEEGVGLLKLIEAEYSSEYQELKTIVETSKDVAGLSILIMSCAAKVHYILKRRREAMNSKPVAKRRGEAAFQIQSEPQKLGWRLTTEQMEKAVELLQQLELAETKE